jgi:hypothetical protein
VHTGKRSIRLTGAASDDAFPPLLLGKAGHKVVRAANFEAEDFLEILALEIYLVSKFCAEIRGMHKWCLFKNLVDLGGQDKAEIVRGLCGQNKVRWETRVGDRVWCSRRVLEYECHSDHSPSKQRTVAYQTYHLK